MREGKGERKREIDFVVWLFIYFVWVLGGGFVVYLFVWEYDFVVFEIVEVVVRSWGDVGWGVVVGGGDRRCSLCVGRWCRWGVFFCSSVE